jgi:hypothetical protein
VLVVEFLWRKFEVKMGFVHKIWKLGDEICGRKKLGMSNTLNFLITTIEETDVQENVMFISP